MPWLALSPTDRPTDKTYVPRPAEFLRLQLRLRVAVFAATIAVATSLALMGIRWWPAFLSGARAPVRPGTPGGEGPQPGSRSPPKGDTR